MDRTGRGRSPPASRSPTRTATPGTASVDRSRARHESTADPAAADRLAHQLADVRIGQRDVRTAESREFGEAPQVNAAPRHSTGSVGETPDPRSTARVTKPTAAYGDVERMRPDVPHQADDRPAAEQPAPPPGVHPARVARSKRAASPDGRRPSCASMRRPPGPATRRVAASAADDGGPGPELASTGSPRDPAAGGRPRPRAGTARSR